MKAAEMLARDLVLRVCGSDGEFRRDWLTRGASPKRVVPFAVAPGADPDFAAAIAGAAIEMGARHLLACRTRAAFMYDTVTVLPVSSQALLALAARWGQPDDFLVCLPDGSAAVLVSVAGYALGAGPPAFVAALAGPDVAGTRQRFTAWARESGDQRLRLVAGRYGNGPPSRHSPRRMLGPDLAERLSRLAAGVRRRRLLAAVLRVSRSAAGWAAVAVIVITLLSAPRASHVLPALGAGLWLLLQVFVLARTHTLSWAACLRMTAAGAACAIAFAAVARLAVSPGTLHTWRAFAGLAEEAAKLVPIGVFWLAARNRFTRLAAVDYLLLGVASGAGFALAENSAAALAAPGAGWHIAALLPGWSDAGAVRFPGHAVTTGLAAAGIGLAVAARPAAPNGWGSRRRWPRWLAWLLPPVLIGLAALDHYHYDAVVGHAAVPLWVARLHAAAGNGHASRWLLVALVAATVAADFAAQRRVADVVPPVPGVPLWAGLARAARGSEIATRLRWSARTIKGQLARRQARLRVAIAEALVAAGHEIAFLLVALRPRRRPRGVFPASLAFTRQRRELAMREARAGGRIRRDIPRREGLWTAWQRLTAVFAAGGAAMLVTALRWPPLTRPAPMRPPLMRSTLTRPPLARPPLARPALAPWAPLAPPGVRTAPARAAQIPLLPRGHGAGAGHALLARQLRPADLLGTIPALHAWFSQFIHAGQVLIVAAALGVFVILVSGWADPVPLVSRQGHGAAGRLLRWLGATPAPGQFVLGALRLAGGLLPPGIARLLAGAPVARPYQRLPPVQHVLPPAGPLAATPQAVAGTGPARRAPRRPGAGELDRSGWLFPPDRVRRWIAHAPEFGLEPAPLDGETTAADLTARLTDVLRRIAEAAGSLRLETVTFRDHPARAVVDRTTGGAVFFTPAGEFTGCALLTEDQLFRLLTEQKL